MWHEAKADTQFQLELAGHRHAFVGRPTPLYAATRLGEHFGGAHIHLKREDLCHTGAHKLNNAVGQALLALRMGKKRVIAETGAGQHGVAVATVGARFGLECTVYMGTEDMRRQSMNVRRMKLLGAEVVEVTSGTKTLKDATSEAIRDWVTNVRTTHYIIGSVVGPASLSRDGARPAARDRRRGSRAVPVGRRQAARRGGRMRRRRVQRDRDVHRVSRRQGRGAGRRRGRGQGRARPASTPPRWWAGGPASCTAATRTSCRTATDRSCRRIRSRPGLDYPGVGPEHSFLRDIERVEYVAVTDKDALAAFKLCTRLEGIMPALEPAHALHHAGVLAREMGPGGRILVCLSGRGDKDMDSVGRWRAA